MPPLRIGAEAKGAGLPDDAGMEGSGVGNGRSARGEEGAKEVPPVVVLGSERPGVESESDDDDDDAPPPPDADAEMLVGTAGDTFTGDTRTGDVFDGETCAGDN